MNYLDLSTGGAQPQMLLLKGAWKIGALAEIESELRQTGKSLPTSIIIDGAGLQDFNISAAALLQSWRAELRNRGIQTNLRNFSPAQQRLFKMLPDDAAFAEQAARKPARDGMFTALGRGVYTTAQGGIDFVGFTGRAAAGLTRLAVQPWKLRPTSIVFHVYEIGLRATPIVILMSFLISIVIGYQGVTQLRQFGAEIYSVDLVAVSLLRELAVLVTAIMVAGRSGSAFTAELGVMKTNEEIDALAAMGLDPFQVLVLPRLLGILIALPLLTIVADFAGLLGGLVMSTSLLHMSPEQFFDRLHQALKVKSFVLGMIKAPFFAFLIGMVGCLRGFQVTGAAEAVGRYTTRAVVDSIFLVITVDAIFSIIYSYLGY